MLSAATSGWGVYWNSPYPQNCADRSGAPNFAQFGVTTNANASFNGGAVFTIYTPTYFKTWPHIGANGEVVNGGVPQLGNLSLHLVQVAADVASLLPDSGFAGHAVIDWEVWKPWLIPASKNIYVNASIAAARAAHPSWDEVALEAEAVRAFNASALHFMEATVSLCRQLRPAAHWGYYGLPGCYTGVSPAPSTQCIASVRTRNDALAPLWRASSGLYPSVYIEPNNARYPWLRSARYVTSEIEEARRVRAELVLGGIDSAEAGVATGVPTATSAPGEQLPVVAFTWYDLFNTSDTSLWHPMLNATDLATEFDTPATAGADGIIVWGSSADVSNPAKCAALGEYINTTLGPVLLRTARTHAHDSAGVS